MGTHRHRLATVALLTLLLGLPAPVVAQTKDDVERAHDAVERAERERAVAYRRWQEASAALEAAVVDYEQTADELDALSYRIATVEDRIRLYEQDLAGLKATARRLVLEAYVTGGSSLVAAAFSAGTIQDLLTTQVLLEKASGRDRAAMTRLEAVRREMDRLKGDLEDDRERVAELEVRAARLVEEMARLQEERAAAYADADAELRRKIDRERKVRAEYRAAEARRKAQEAARARADASGAAAGLPPEATPSFTCPVEGGAAFINSWGFPRSGGTRRHKGVDMFAPRGTRVVAVTDGTLKLRTVNLGGIVAYVYGDDGNKYYYAHLDGYVPDITSGQRVRKGQPIGYVGNSGNARYSSPHLHFEIRPGGGAAVNPYPTVRYYCP